MKSMDKTGVTIFIRFSKQSDKSILMELVNGVYDVCEQHLWLENHKRLTEEMFEFYHSNQELLVAERCDIIVGCVVMSSVDDGAKDMSMLVIRPEFQRLGIGNLLGSYVIDSALKDKCRCVRVESLYPSHQPDPWKQTLIKWYKSLGFQFVKNVDIAEQFPDFVNHLAVEATFSIFEKSIG